MTLFDYLSSTAQKYPNKPAYIDEYRTLDYKSVLRETYHIAYALISKKLFKKPVIIYLDKSVECIPAFFGVAHSGNFYSPIDTKMPQVRIEKILATLKPEAIITDKAHISEISEFAGSAQIIVYEDTMTAEIDEAAVREACRRVLDTDILYVLFTSGSTGDPKGAIVSHRAFIDFAEWAVKALNLDETIIFGNQAPFYFSFSVWDIYLPVFCGGSSYIIPHEKFKFPALLMQYLDDHKINSLTWVPSALSMVSALHALSSPHLSSLKNVFFGGEAMHIKQLNRWRKEYPDVKFYNLYGSTEDTDTCMIYEVRREIQNTEQIPVGVACENKEILILDENNNLVTDDGIGEICVRGSGIGYGYYNNPEKTAEVFVQNPLNKEYPEIIYRTGDLAQKNEYGEWVYIGRKDFQIKYMGHRIELGEIETAACSLEQVEMACCIFDADKSRITIYYTGNITENGLTENLKKLLPGYMIPSHKIHLDEMPLNLSGKIDRRLLKEKDK